MRVLLFRIVFAVSILIVFSGCTQAMVLFKALMDDNFITVEYRSLTDTKSETLLVTVNGESDFLKHGEVEEWTLESDEQDEYLIRITASIVGHEERYHHEMFVKDGYGGHFIITSSDFSGLQ
jgi:hypothetical protein